MDNHTDSDFFLLLLTPAYPYFDNYVAFFPETIKKTHPNQWVQASLSRLLCLPLYQDWEKKGRRREGGAACLLADPNSPLVSPSPSPPFPSLPIAEWWISGGIFYGMPPKSNPLPLSQHHLTTFPSQGTWTSYLEFKRK